MNNLKFMVNWQRSALLIASMVFVGSLYMMTYSGRIESGDTRFMFDATASMVRFGDMRLDMTAGQRPFWDYENPLPELPLLPVDAEPLQILLSTPLYWLANQLPSIGRVHAVWLFNVFVSMIAVGVFYLYALELDYGEQTAVIGAVLFGTCTIIWAYSKTFFQEPLTLLLILLSAFFVERWRKSHFCSWRMFVLWVVCYGLALFARRASLMALPVLTIVMFPWLDGIFEPLRRRKLILVLAVIIGGLLYYNTIPQSAQELSRFYRHVEHIPWYDRTVRAAMNQGVQGYLFVLGGSIWGTSPVVLLALPGLVMLARRNQMRYVLAALTMLLTYTLAYAYGSNFHWFGGLSWPPRFLIPVIPFLMLCTLPTIDYLHRSSVWIWYRILTGLLVVYSLWIQFNAVSYWWGEYPQLLPSEANGFLEWSGGLNDVHYLRWVLLPQLWGKLPFDFAWVRTDAVISPILFVVLGVTAGVFLIVGYRAVFSADKQVEYLRWQRMLSVLMLPILFTVAIVVHLRVIYADDLYLSFSDGLHNSVSQINEQLTDNDILIISQLGYEQFFLNYGKIDNPRIISLPLHPGEQSSPDQPPQITSLHPIDLLEKPTVQLLDTLAQTHDSLWVLADTSPFVAWSVRPLERFMALYYYPVQVMDLTGNDGLPVRLVEFNTAAHHDPFTLVGADYATDLQFGDDILLAGFNLPLGEVYNPGDDILLSLNLMTDTLLETSYSVALHLAREGVGVVASAQDSPPYFGFTPTTDWYRFEPIWDNRVVRLPQTLTAGEYRLWISLYTVNADGMIEHLLVEGSERVEDGTIGVLPVSIKVEIVQ